MMTRMERATATWALVFHGCGRCGGTARRGRSGCGRRRWRLAEGAAQPGVALALLAAAGAGAGLAGRGAQPGPGHQVGGGGEPDMSRPTSEMMARARSGMMPGISASLATTGSTAASGAAPAAIASIMSCAEMVVSLLATDETLTRAAGQLLDQPGPHPGVIPQVPDRLGRHERRPQQPPSRSAGP